MSKKNNLVVIGSTNWDICMYLPKLPAPGETVGGGQIRGNLGGKGANQAVACRRAGVETLFVTCLGDDPTGETARSQLAEMGLNPEGIDIVHNCATGTATIFIDATGENCIGLAPGANDQLSPERIQQKAACLRDASVLLLQLEIPLESVLAAIKLAAENQVPVILNPAPACKLPQEIYPHIRILTPNRGELGVLTGMPTQTETELIAAARHLVGLGTGKVIVTLGAIGALLVESDSHRFFAPFEVSPQDTTAAGDCFNGYLAASLVTEGIEQLDQAIDLAMAAAAISVTRPGAIPSIPDRDQVVAFMQNADFTQNK